jgi:hypothetical protein
MKRNLIGTVSAMALSLLITTNGAYAQSAARANVPFGFNVGTTHLPAGTYKIKRADFDSNFIMVSNINTGDTVLSLFRREAPGHISHKLIFHRSGDRYDLAEIWGGEGNAGMAVPVIKAERKVEIASNPAPTQNIMIALR